MCDKKKFDKIKAMMIVAYAQKRAQKNFARRECRVYYCPKCKAWHTTSQKINKK
jgi:hypothetical protein